MKPTRRTLITGAAVGGAALTLGLLPFIINGRREEMTPAQARHRGAPLASLNVNEVSALERLGEVLLPGAAEAGIVHFIDHHVSVPAAESLLTVRYFDVPPPYLDFYRSGLAAIDAYARAAHNRAFAALPAVSAEEMVTEIARTQPSTWRGPPSQLLYLALRSDAVDVVYGTTAGFERLGVPYMAHILPDQAW